VSPIRRAVASDQDAIRDLLRQLHGTAASEATLPAVRQQARTFLATAGGTTIGLAVATFVDYGVEPYGTIEELVVDAAHRGNGVGSALLEQCREWLTGLGARVIFGSAIDAAAATFYGAADFVSCTGPWLFWTPPDKCGGRSQSGAAP
jgi:GNAT superfamily N-acetyltransferase